MEQSCILEAKSAVAVSVAQARQWFLDLEAHPERYTLETHAGFAFTQGGFGQVGARFVTWERFYGLRLALHFDLTEVGKQHFRFDLLRPRFPVWGVYAIEDAGAGGGMILAPTAGPYAARLSERQQETIIRFIDAGHRWGQYSP